MESSQLDCEEILSNFQQVLELMEMGVSEEVTNKWVNELVPAQIQGLQGLLRCRGFTIAERAKFQNTIGLLHSIHNRMKRFLKSGAGLQDQQQPSVVWNEIQSAFDRRILTGAISNLQHTDLSAFFDDAEVEFEKQIKITLKDHNSLKVYGVLAVEFFISKADNEIIEKKYFNTEAQEIYLTTSLSEWFTKYIKRPILKYME